MQQTSVVLVGLGGYGGVYVSALLDGAPEGVRIAGAVDPAPERCERLAELQARGVPLFASLEEFYAAGLTAELAAIASPIHYHCPLTCLALEHGSHVLCEKPLAATPAQAEEMRRARDRAGKAVAIGYQWSFSPAIHALKADIAAGRLGKPLRLRCLVLWPRDEAYYCRSSWAGALEDAGGRPVLDSPVNNAAAHYLHNMLYVLGERPDRSAWPAEVTAELYRANAITNYDTAALRCRTAAGTEVFFVTSHAVRRVRGPEFRYEFEDAVVTYADSDRRMAARFRDGSVKEYGSPAADPDARKLWETLAAIREGRPVACGIEAAAAHTACVFAAQHSAEISPFPPALVHVEGEPGKRKTWVAGLDDAFIRCYEELRLPAELGIAWAAAGRRVEVNGSMG